MKLRFFIFALAFVACGDDDRTDLPDLGEDLGTSEMGADASADALTDSGADLGPDLGPPVEVSYACTADVGLDRPFEACAPDSRCPNVEPLIFTMPRDEGVEPDPYDTETPAPPCESNGEAIAAGRFAVSDGVARTFEVDGVERRACVAEPESFEPGRPRALVLFLHGLGGSAQDLYLETNLRRQAEDFRVGPLGTPSGFFLASLQARNVHGPNTTDGPHWDHAFRDLYGEGFEGETMNADVRFIDRVIDALVAEYPDDLDTDRIYVVGWDDGGEMALFYGLLRHDAPTPGGQRVAAIATVGAKDPFVQEDESDESCALATLPVSNVPILYISRSCDTVACDTNQLIDLNRGTPIQLPPGSDAEALVRRLAVEAGNENIERVILGPRNGTTNCASSSACFRRAAEEEPDRDATRLHRRWIDDIGPEGIDNNDYEPRLLDWLADNPLPLDEEEPL
ncbi:MAG: hypothetical protein AAF447_02470 [Myxococcota bacterium]